MAGKGRRHNLSIKTHRKPVVEYLRGVEEQNAMRNRVQSGQYCVSDSIQ